MNDIQTISNSDAKLKATKLTWDDKKALCEQWKKSGKNKSKFCKEYGISLQTFCSWCDKLWPSAKKQRFLSKVLVVNQNNLKAEPDPATIEISLPNNAVIRFSVAIDKIASLIREICYANTIIR